VTGVKHFAPSTALSVPSALAPVVLGITNLDDFRPKAHVVFRKNMRPRPSFTGAGSTSASNETIFFAPGDIAVAYDITPLYNSSVTGAGQSITIVGQSAIQVTDLQAFQSAAGVNSTQTPNQYVVPNSGTPTVEADGDEAESDLDLEWSNAIAPGANINFVYTGSNTSYGAFDSIVYAIDEQIGTIISSSYGTCELELNGFTLESSLEQGTAQGQTIMAAAGDDGSTDCNEYAGTGTLTTLDTTLAVDYPASSPNVTAMGGTEINQTQAKYNTVGDGYWQSDPSTSSDIITSVLQYIPEVVWNDDALTEQYGGTLSASGGGISTLFNKPSWQTALTPNDGKRDVPDLALYASPNYPGYLYCTSDQSAWESTQGQQSSCTSGFEDSATGVLTAAGGTSFDGPIFSGMLALINQKQGYAAGQGLINPTLYTLAGDATTYGKAFHDITSGNNDCKAGSAYCGSQQGGYSAGVGYDLVSGLGSVDADQLADAWPASTTTSTLAATTTTITASSSSPNVGASVSFTIGITASGVVVPSGSLTVIVDTNASVTETFTGGAYTYTIPTGFTTAGAHTVFVAFVADSTYAASSASATVVVGAVSSGKGTIAFTPAPSPSTLTVSQGTSGTETLSVTPAGGYTGTVDLSFDTSADTTLQNLCWLWTNETNAGDGTLPITGTTAVTTQLELDTNASDCASSNGAIRRGGKQLLHKLRPAAAAKNGGGNPAPLAMAFAGLLLVGFLGRASRKLRGLAGLILLAAVGLAVTACGSNVSSTVSDPPKGSYTITVTGTDSVTSTITSTTTFSFVIN
jgi:subtilase family serine protease